MAASFTVKQSTNCGGIGTKILLFVTILSIVFFIGCNSNESVDGTNTSTAITADSVEDTQLQNDNPNADMEANVVDPNQLPPSPPPQENLIEDAKKNPITTLALSESNYDFKDVKKGKVVDHKFEITNTGKNPLIISAVKPGCGCTVPEYTTDPILPGKKGFVNLKFDSSSFDGLQNKSAEVYANVESVPIILSFSANVVQ